MAIKPEDVKQYWDKRAAEQGARTVGFNNQSMRLQDDMYNERTKFFKLNIPKSILENTKVLEFGCGIGRYCNMFNNYIGVDITEELINLAQKTNKHKIFKQIGIYEKLNYSDIETLFTATVLQHNSDDSVKRIIESLPENIQWFFIYENSEVQSGTVQKRTSNQYLNLFKNKFKGLQLVDSVTHKIHKENHTLTVMING